jgi:hypothetical protein
VTLTAAFGDLSTGGVGQDPDEALSTRLRDLALVDLDALGAGNHALIGVFADDVAHALGETRARIAALRGQLGGPEPLNVLDLTTRQRASDSGTAGAGRSRDRLVAQAEAARSLARLADLSAPLVPKLFEADRRR